MAKITHGITGQRTLPAMLERLRKPERAEAFAASPSALTIPSAASWAWTIESDEGEFLASAAVVDEAGEGWVVAYPGAALVGIRQIMPLVRMFRTYQELGPHDTLRAWVAAEDERAIRFATWCGLLYECGPAIGFSPTGRDMSLFVWRRQ